MDEPTEGLAPIIVEQVVTLLQTLSQNGIALLIIEQNLQVALQVADHVGIMVNGAIVEFLPSTLLATDPDLQQRHLGIGVNSPSAQPKTVSNL
jgi:branched-chain amino acid transport system ATP-binding protein